MTNAYYNHTTFPATSSSGSSALARAEFDAITAGFALLPTLAGNGGKIVVVDPTGNFLTTAAVGNTISGTAAAPGLPVTGYSTTGLFSAAANTIGFSISGVQGMLLDASSNLTIKGSTLTMGALGTNATLTQDGSNYTYLRGTGVYFQDVSGTHNNLWIDSSNRIGSNTMHNNAAVPAGVTNSYIASGTWTPTTGSLTNITAITPYQGQWLRVGNVVTCSFVVSITPTATGIASCILYLPLGTANDPTHGANAAGSLTNYGGSGVGSLIGSSGSGSVYLEINAQNTTPTTWCAHLTYLCG